jgi:hypothetical protein
MPGGSTGDIGIDRPGDAFGNTWSAFSFFDFVKSPDQEISDVFA